MARSQSPGDFQDFWQEYRDIESSKDPNGEEEETAKTPDEGEKEVAWLKEAGYGFVVSRYNAGKELSEDDVRAMTESLASNHAAVIKKRVDTLNATLRKKQKYTTKIDVRNIFPQQTNSAVNSSEMTDTSSNSKQHIFRPSTLPHGMKLLSVGNEHGWIKQISLKNDGTKKFVSSIRIESPRSPTSPRQEVIHPEWGANRPKNRGSLLKNKGGYSMSGVSEEVIDNAELGVEMLSMQQKASYHRTNSQLSPISDSDITFDFAIEENGIHGTNHEQDKKTDSLPNFILSEDKLGITHIDDISEADMEYVRKLGLLELTSLFDTYSISYSARRAKKKHKEHGIFGIPLDILMEHDQKRKSNAKIPLAFQAILSYLVKYSLDTEGILRIPGLISRVKQLRVDLEEKFYQGLFIWGDEVTPNDVAALMKQFLRELPTPLLTNEYIDAFAQVENLPTNKHQLHALNLLILLLPPDHRNTLKALLLYLDRVIAGSSINKMGLSNVAMIMAPNLFLTTNAANKRKDAWEIEMKLASGTSSIMKMLIKYRHILWTVPSYLMSHVRRQYELEQIKKNKDKMKTKFLAKKDKTDVYKKPAVKHESDFQEGVIRVYAPHLTKNCTAVQLDLNTTAGDIVSRFRVMQGSQTWDPRRSSQSQKFHQGQVSFVNPANFMSAGDDTFLYEVGGNVGERRLPNNTNMSMLYKVNPNAEWIIKQQDSDVFSELFS